VPATISFDWRDKAPCSDLTDTFYPSRSSTADSGAVRRATRICLTECSFRRECLTECYTPVRAQIIVDYDSYGDPITEDRELDISEEGIWGGTTPEDRKRVAHFPVAQRIEALLSFASSNVTGPYRPADREEVMG
jgi:hypothetical protein